MRLLKAAFVCATLTTSLLLVGCGGTPAAEPETASEEPPAETVVEDEEAQPDGEALVEEILSRNDYEPKDVEPDEDVMASMTCVPLTQEQLHALARGRSIFFSEPLCARYFTCSAGGAPHFVLFDDADTIRCKLAVAAELGIGTALLDYGQTADVLAQIFGDVRG